MHWTDRRTVIHRATLGVAMAGCLVALLVACSTPTNSSGQTQANAMQEATVREGDVVVRASALPTMAIGETIAKQYGIARAPGTVMLLVAVRRGDQANETALTAKIVASTSDLLGKREDIALHEVRSGEFVDYAGVANVIAPDTLRFDLRVAPAQGPAMTLQFNRDFFADQP